MEDKSMKQEQKKIKKETYLFDEQLKFRFFSEQTKEDVAKI